MDNDKTILNAYIEKLTLAQLAEFLAAIINHWIAAQKAKEPDE